MAKKANPTTPTTETHRPIKTLEAWPIKAAVWANTADKDGETRTFHSVTFERRYRAQDGTWRSTQSFGVEDLPKLALLATKAFDQLVVEARDGDAA